MKSSIVKPNGVTIIFLIFLSTIYIKADSPITSTPIDSAYNDIEMVKYAKKQGKMDEKISEYLHSSETNIDLKAAVINAIGWDFDGTENAKEYSLIVFSKSLNKLNLDDLNSDDLFCLGYLQVLDDYFHPEKAIRFIERAKELNDTSFTVAIINALIQAQKLMVNQGSWCDMWSVVSKVFNDKHLVADLRDAAKKIIWNYMILYKC
jgi:hypothetical protein